MPVSLLHGCGLRLVSPVTTVSPDTDSLLAVESKRRNCEQEKRTQQSRNWELFYACFGWFTRWFIDFFALVNAMLWFAVRSNTVPVLAASFNPYLWWSQYVLSMTYSDHISLVGGLEPWNFMTVHSVGNFIIPTDVHSIIFQRGRYTSNQETIPISPDQCFDNP